MSGEEESNDQIDAQDTNENSVRKITFPSIFNSKRPKFTTKKTYKNILEIFHKQNESSAQSSAKEADIDTNRSKRFDFLLKQTEIFSHFMPGSSSSKLSPEKKKKPGRKKEKEEELDPDRSDPSIDPAE